jgi:hypothetical protein
MTLKTTEEKKNPWANLLALGFVLLCTVGTIIGGYIHGHMSISAVIKNLK